MGAAGALAEMLAIDFNITAVKALSWLQRKRLSDTDAALIVDMTEADVAQALGLLRAAWPELLAFADDLVAACEPRYRYEF